MAIDPNVRIDPSVWIAPSAEIYGEVHIEAGASVWPQVVIRAECQEVRIGAMTNIQDFVMIHVGYEEPTRIGAYCSVTHHAVVHGAILEDCVLIGPNATVMTGAVVGRGSIVAAGAVIGEGKVIPPNSIVAGVPGRVIKERDSAAENRWNAWAYWRNAEAYKRGDHRTWADDDWPAWSEERRRESEEAER